MMFHSIFLNSLDAVFFMIRVQQTGRETMKTYEADVRLSNGSVQRVRIQADRSDNARAMLEAQYGKGCIVMFRDA